MFEIVWVLLWRGDSLKFGTPCQSKKPRTPVLAKKKTISLLPPSACTRPPIRFVHNTQSPEESSSPDTTGPPAVVPLREKDYPINANDLPAWGVLQVFNSRVDAFRSLTSEEQEDKSIRLLHVATNTQLKRMLQNGKEVCPPGAELYLRVAPTCPLY